MNASSAKSQKFAYLLTQHVHSYITSSNRNTNDFLSSLSSNRKALSDNEKMTKDVSAILKHNKLVSLYIYDALLSCFPHINFFQISDDGWLSDAKLFRKGYHRL